MAFLKLLVLCFELFVFMVPAFVFHGIIVASQSLYLQIIWHQLLASKYKFGWNND
jgi:hypothetical protein